jgi:hypothetical protein
VLLLLLKIGVLLVYAVPEAAFVLPARVTISMQPARLSEILGACRPRVFAESVNAATEILNGIGEPGYAEKWSAHPFPALQLQELRRLLELSHETA